ncbi:MAG: hypothetical protein ABI869_04585 [Actinomycetota bacterium]
MAGESRRRLAKRDGHPSADDATHAEPRGQHARSRTPDVQDLDREERVEDVKEPDEEELAAADAQQKSGAGLRSELP